MNSAFASSRAPEPRGLLARWWAEPEIRSTLIGVIGVLLIHLLLWLLAPHLLRVESVSLPLAPAPGRQFDIELQPEENVVVRPKETKPFRFLEANPDAPDNTPDKPDYFSNRNQQLAQEKPNPDGKSDRPATEGKNEQPTTQIVDGRFSNPLEQAQPLPQVVEEPREQTAAAPKIEQNPLPGFEKKEGDDKESFGSNVTRIPQNVRPIPERIEGTRDLQAAENATDARRAIDRNRPQPRPQLVKTTDARPAFLNKDPGTSNIGVRGANTRWSEYGEYMNRMVEAIHQEWEKVLLSRNTMPPAGTFVVVKFILNSQGMVARVVGVENHSNELGAAACVAAISGRAPYGPWPDDMKAALGEQDELTFVFHYMTQ